MKPDYKNWVPKGMVFGYSIGAAATLVATVVSGYGGFAKSLVWSIVLFAVFALVTVLLLVVSAFMIAWHTAFSYDGKRQLSRRIIEKTAAKVVVPAGGKCLDVGCGSGRNVDALLKKYDGSFVTAVDYSDESVKKAKKFNKKNASRCEIKQGDVKTLDLPEGEFDLATAFETVYFWQGIEDCFRNVFGILKFGGRFLIVNESDGEDETGKKFENIIEGMKVYTAEELTDALKKAGFSDVKVARHGKNPWIAVLATK